MYPNLYYIFRDWFGVEWPGLSIFNSFGLMVALGFVAAAWVLTSELKRKEQAGLFQPREEIIIVGKPASASEIIFNAVTGFVFGYKLLGFFFARPENMNPQEFIFSAEGSFLGGLLGAVVLGGAKWYDKNKTKLPVPERRTVRIWPHDRVGDIIILGLIFGILGAKLFDNLENWNDFIQHPIESIFSASGLTFYGGLILAALAICWYAYKKGITLRYLADATAPALMIAYAIGRIGCQVSGDGDWGIFNSAYTSDANGKVTVAMPGDFEKSLAANAPYFTDGKIKENNKEVYITNRAYGTLENVPHKSFKGPSFLPTWLFAYSYPNNVNKDGVPIPGNKLEHNRVLPQPVFPTPLYETIICTFFFILMWMFRRSITTPIMMFGIYLVLNGSERFFIETMRVNKGYAIFGMRATQAELIAISLVIIGIGLMIYAKLKVKNKA